MLKSIDITEFGYDLPDEKIAKYPVVPRDSSKLLFYKAGKIQHDTFTNLSAFLPKNTTLVFNDTKVIPARLYFHRSSGALLEIFLLSPADSNQNVSFLMAANKECTWECIIGNKKKWKIDEVLTSEINLNGEIVILSASWLEYDNNLVKLNWTGNVPFAEILEIAGNMPLPPYLNRKPEEADKQQYQTTYSAIEGAVAAPTAGLHFTEKVLSDLGSKSINKIFLTLHVGAGTFLPVKVENALEHPMHKEQMIFSKNSVNQLLDGLENPILPVGTTSMRSIESLYWFGVKLLEKSSEVFFIEKLYPYKRFKLFTPKESLKAILEYMELNKIGTLVGNTEIMIFPGYEFQICNGIITNFHQPNSTLLLLVSALVGGEKWKTIYKEALDNDYRFLSFGDSSLLIP